LDDGKKGVAMRVIDPVRLIRQGAGRAFLLSLALIGSATAFAQAFPVRPIKLIVPFSAGSATDTLARSFGPKMGEALGQPVTIRSRARQRTCAT
jgi:tripartite-type tricarboxylate transporter receptor subunit TctC